MKFNIRQWFGLALLAGVVGLSGCQTTDQADTGALASVAVPGHTVAAIQRATTKVFASNGYQQADPLVFGKPGTAWDTAAYGGWSTGSIWIKVRVYIVAPKTGDCTLSCNAYMVTDRNQPGMEQEQKLSHSRRSECKKILDQVKTLLDSQPETAAQ